MCGNGIRCVAKLLYDRDPALRRPRPAHRDRRRRAGAASWTSTAAASRTVDGRDGPPAPDARRDPDAGPAARRACIARADRGATAATFHLTAVSMGNPHAVIFVDDRGDDLRALAEAFGPAARDAPSASRGAPTSSSRTCAASGEIDLVVWERGCGITLACGTGACATVVAACLEERLSAGPRDARPPAGRTARHHRRARTTRRVRMRGPARSVFEASIDVARLMSGN